MLAIKTETIEKVTEYSDPQIKIVVEGKTKQVTVDFMKVARVDGKEVSRNIITVFII